MMDGKVLIITEANETVASGHLFESIVTYNIFKKNCIDVSLMVNDDMPDNLKERLPLGYVTYISNIQQETEYLCRYVEEQGISILFFNLRKIENDFINAIKRCMDVFIICIDEFGHRRLDADIIVNPMVDEYYWNYPETNARIFCGSKYLVLPESVSEFHVKEKKINERICNITVSMGGVDAKGTTLKLAKWIPKCCGNANINIVIGGGFPYKQKLLKIINRKDKVTLYENISYLHEMFYNSDLAVCAGGNTLHELAAIGVPTIVIPSMPHEVKNGQKFQRKGFSMCCSCADSVTEDELAKAILCLNDSKCRRLMSENGKKLADGKGAERIYEVLTDNFC
jgi:spore coat polysaccharide biosynthesis predicted glycosyltransferase SpsG